MEQENIVLIAIHIVMAIVVAINYALIIVIWKYYKNKALGKQTILDQLGRDGLVLLAIALPINWMSGVKIVPNYNYYLALAAMKSTIYSRVILCAQTLGLFVIRYIYVFHFTWISEKSETTMTVVLRILVFALAMVITIFEDVSELFRFRYLIEETIDEKNEYGVPKISFVFYFITLLVIIFVQVSIVLYKRKDSNLLPPTEQKTSDKYLAKTISFLCLVVLISAAILMLQILNFNSAISQSLRFLYSLVMSIIAMSIFIYSNEKLLKFCKRTLPCSSQSVPSNPNPLPPTYSFKDLIDAENSAQNPVQNDENIFDPNALDNDDDRSVNNIRIAIQPHIEPLQMANSINGHNDLPSVDC